MTSITETVDRRPAPPRPEDTLGEQRQSQRRQFLGAALVVLSTAAIAIVPSFAKLAYEGGSDTLTVITGRSLVTAAVCFLASVLLGRPLRIPRPALLVGLGLGALYAVHLYAFLGAVAYQPVNMVVLIYYLHPLMIGIAAVCAGREVMSPMRLGALAAAFLGMTLAVGFSLEDLSLVGTAFALVAAFLAATVIMGSPLAMKGGDCLVALSFMMLSAATCLVALCLAQGRIRLPATEVGWLGFGGVAAAHTVGTITFFIAIPLLGAVRAAMISNLEPVLGILFAMMVLGERVSPIQGGGIALVIGSIFALEIARRDARPS